MAGSRRAAAATLTATFATAVPSWPARVAVTRATKFPAVGYRCAGFAPLASMTPSDSKSQAKSVNAGKPGLLVVTENAAV